MPFSCAKFRPLRVIKKKNKQNKLKKEKKKERKEKKKRKRKRKKKKGCNSTNIGLAVGTPAGFEPRKAYFKRSRWFGKQHKTDAFTKLVVSGSGPSELHVPHEQCMTSISEAVSAFSKFIFYRCPPMFVTGSPVPPTKACLYSALHPQALTEYSVLDFQSGGAASNAASFYGLWWIQLVKLTTYPADQIPFFRDIRVAERFQCRFPSTKPFCSGIYKNRNGKTINNFIVQELCESRGGRPGLSVLTSLLVSVDVKL